VSALSVHEVLLRPIISEKSTVQTERNNYTFAVAREANKLQIRAAVERQFNVDVLGVRVINVKPKEKRRGRGRRAGLTSSWRKAIVTLAPGQKIEFFEGV
jgi:large subunit ribosomal protein L23